MGESDSYQRKETKEEGGKCDCPNVWLVMVRFNQTMPPPQCVNINVGILGHVDSGKTSLAKALSSVGSTAAFDKNPQSQSRGITLDLGFSTFMLPLNPEQTTAEGDDKMTSSSPPPPPIQVTLVDCPGHASLVRTIIGGALIIDLVILVIDAQKGFQTQTAECLVIAEITASKMIVVLNKIDLFPESTRATKIATVTKGVQKVLSTTKFAGCPVIPVAADVAAGADVPQQRSLGLKELFDAMGRFIEIPKRTSEGAFLFAVDHCFAIKGQGTVLTGTVLNGCARVGETIEIPSLKVQKKIKSMQVFRKPVETVMQGDRVGICVTQLDAALLERGIAGSPGSIPVMYAVIMQIHPIRFYKSEVRSKAKFHVSVGHETVMGSVQLFIELPSESGRAEGAGGASFNWHVEYQFLEQLNPSQWAAEKDPPRVWGLLHLEVPVPCPPGALVIASKLDGDLQANVCRLAFYGNAFDIISTKDYHQSVLSPLKIFKTKTRAGTVDRVVDEYTLIGRELFKKEARMDKFIGLKVELSTGEKGYIEAPFGQSGKFKVRIPGGLGPQVLLSLTKGKSKAAEGEPESQSEPDKGAEGGPKRPQIVLTFKKYIFDESKKIVQ